MRHLKPTPVPKQGHCTRAREARGHCRDQWAPRRGASWVGGGWSRCAGPATGLPLHGCEGGRPAWERLGNSWEFLAVQGRRWLHSEHRMLILGQIMCFLKQSQILLKPSRGPDGVTNGAIPGILAHTAPGGSRLLGQQAVPAKGVGPGPPAPAPPRTPCSASVHWP